MIHLLSFVLKLCLKIAEMSISEGLAKANSAVLDSGIQSSCERKRQGRHVLLQYLLLRNKCVSLKPTDTLSYHVPGQEFRLGLAG